MKVPRLEKIRWLHPRPAARRSAWFCSEMVSAVMATEFFSTLVEMKPDPPVAWASSVVAAGCIGTGFKDIFP